VHSDPIADMATRMRNAVKASHTSVLIPHSNLKETILSVLKRKNYIADYQVVKDGKFEALEVTFIPNKELNIKRISRPGHRRYSKGSEIPTVLNGYGISIVSTSAGVMAGHEAFHQGIGGEILLEVY